MRPEVICIGNLSRDTVKFNGKITQSIGGPVYYMSQVFTENNINHALIGNADREFNFDKGSYLNLSGIQHSQTTAEIKIDIDNPENTCVENYPGKINLNKIPKNLLDCRYLAISTIFEDIDPTHIKVLKNKNNIVALDIQGFTRTLNDEKKVIRKKFDLSLLRGIDILKLNNLEFVTLFDSDIKKLLEFAKGNHVKNVILSKNKNGVYFYDCSLGDFSFIRTIPLNNVDNTGSGDMLLASFICFLINGYEPLKAIENAQKYVLDKLIKRKNQLSEVKNEL
jgi:sugar/nucleoside kinase (ribokinase family)